MIAVDDAARKSAPRMAFRPSVGGLRLAPIAPAEADASLVRLARLEARSRLALGRAAARFLTMRGYDRLGFRLGDYARERLGISGRELSSFAFVASRLAERPRLAAAFARGELSWSKTRIVCAIGAAGTEEIWLERALEMTVGELVEAIRDEGPGRRPSEVAEALDEEADTTEGESRVRLSIHCPARVRVLWRRALEMARRMIGAQAPVWQAAEAIAAEASSGDPGLVGRSPDESVDASPSARSLLADARLPELASPEACRDDEDDDFESCDAFELDGEMRLRIDELRGVDARLGCSLRRFSERRLHRALGFTRFDVYVRDRLGISPAKARSLILLDRCSRELDHLGRAYRAGELSWVRALAILPVVRGETEQAWVARAGEVMVRRLQDEVDWALDRKDVFGVDVAPPEHGARLERPDLQICARSEGEIVDRRVTFFGPASVVGLVRSAVVGLTGANEPCWKGLERLLLHAITQWEAEPRHRDPIFARDGWRCVVPGCTGRRNLHDHHLTWRSRGGGNEQENRVPVCAAHHLHGIHRGTIRASGRAPDDISWELGVSPGRAPLLVLDGERYRRPSAL